MFQPDYYNSNKAFHSRHYQSFQQQPLPQYQPPQHSHHYSTGNFYPSQLPPPPPPPHHQHHQSHSDFFQQQAHQAQLPAYAPPLPQLPLPQQQQAQQVANNVAGGVSAVLDYDVDEIVKFLTLVSVNIFKQFDTLASSQLETKLKSVITATRLPKSSILLSILYLSNKVATAPASSTTDIYTNVIISLLLANKFNDDSTFTNKSWSHASGLEIRSISHLEIEFLTILNYDLKTIMEDASFRVLQNSFEDWCVNNKHQQEQELAAVQHQHSPLEATQSQFLPSSPPSYYSGGSSYATPVSYMAPAVQAPQQQQQQQQQPTPPNATKYYYNNSAHLDSLSSTNFSSSPIANPYLNQYYGNYYADYYRVQAQQAQAAAQLGYYYGPNEQFVPCY